ncbi:SAM-dependent methyltransferase [Geosporobacter ferrireducens]|uniref:tRNA (N6-threonylcarbamoyladenosine(37)-N6)-methyltransferase TrmO n=1 Tax=Geosporobacter ferrireducens TaxID=1424294 RepID=A0A1D8GPN9_9FIRM|nr:SAM-dependent methyltransferase [Geosporobacter ferrireducens]AOT72899.1 tRNA (N6-threonylcarbamoyladenosine(37)-N6)-methyltransferase TrmO [Geosporobacter ferrireducens]MTI55304.1 SAM-dependent methyltransferase [Geosporobacter ferrireducens]
MEQFTVKPIGKVCVDDNGTRLELDKEYIPALTNLEGFGYINVLWWFDQCDQSDARSKLIEKSPYKNSPEMLGTFATRSPERPNPIALSCSYVTYIDSQNGIIGLAYIDAENGTPVLDIKPYTPSLDRVEHPSVPEWCSHWPKNVEDSGDFDWSAVFNF